MSYDVAVIGSGPGGYIAAIRASQLGLKTCVIEQDKSLGGTCLNVGCIPSKTLLHASKEYSHLVQKINESVLDFNLLQNKKKNIVSGLSDGIAHLFQNHKIEQITGKAKLVDAHRIQVNDQTIEAKSIILATGSEPIALGFLPFDEKKILSSTGALALDHVPESMIVIGGGAIGLELASVYSRLGTKVTVVEMLPTISAGVDTQMALALYAELQKQNITFMLGTQVLKAKNDVQSKEKVVLQVKNDLGELQELSAEVVLVAIGRRAKTSNIGIGDTVNITLSKKGNIVVDGAFRTSIPNIYAIGDLVDGPMLAHKASYEGVFVAEHIAGKASKLEYMCIPNVIYTSPELATVGLNEQEARDLNLPILIGKCAFKGNPRARTQEDTEGLVKVIADKQTERILGMHILCTHASEMIEVGVLALYKRMTLSEVGDLPFAHPTYSEAIKEACLHALGRSYHL